MQMFLMELLVLHMLQKLQQLRVDVIESYEQLPDFISWHQYFSNLIIAIIYAIAPRILWHEIQYKVLNCI